MLQCINHPERQMIMMQSWVSGSLTLKKKKKKDLIVPPAEEEVEEGGGWGGNQCTIIAPIEGMHFLDWCWRMGRLLLHQAAAGAAAVTVMSL